jgi:hypothetical protein
VPRVGGRSPTASALCGLALLCVLALFGAALAHIVEYHLGLGSADWRRSALAMLARCPLSGGLAIVLVGTLATLYALLAEVRFLRRRHAALTRQAARAGLRATMTSRATARDPIRALELLAPLLGVQIAIYTVIDHLWPMGAVMRMDGVWMSMPSQGALPLLPLHVAIAVALALIVWRLERGITQLRAAIETVYRLLPLFLIQSRAAPLPSGPATPPLSVQASPSLLSRPPPARLLGCW